MEQSKRRKIAKAAAENFYSGAELLFFDGGFLHGSDVHNGDGEASVPRRRFLIRRKRRTDV